MNNNLKSLFLLHSKYIIIGLVCISQLSSCKKLVEPSPPSTSLSELDVFNSNATAIAALNGIYSKMNAGSFGGESSLTVLAGLSADELNLISGGAAILEGHYRNELNSGAAAASLAAGTSVWNDLYTRVYNCNSIIEGLSNSTGLSDETKQQLLGEVKFIRGLFYFYLVNLYGELPLVTNRDFEVNRLLGRLSVDSVYSQIIKDVSEARDLLNDNFVGADVVSITTERVRPTKAAAAALLSRVYLYTNNFAGAEAAASSVIDAVAFRLTAVDSVFLKNSDEAIWQVQPVSDYEATGDGYYFILANEPSSLGTPVYLSDTLLNSFETGDLRKNTWIASFDSENITYYYPFKYTEKTYVGSHKEYFMMFRMAEQYLIRAEARVKQGNLMAGLSDLNAVRNRAGLADFSSADSEEILRMILHERQVELFTEMGHRWLDLKRSNTVDAVMSGITPLKGGTWQPTDKLYPVPYDDITRDPNLDQNEGYN